MNVLVTANWCGPQWRQVEADAQGMPPESFATEMPPPRVEEETRRSIPGRAVGRYWHPNDKAWTYDFQEF